MKVDNLMIDAGASDYYDEGFRATLEALLPTYRASVKTTAIPIPPNHNIVYAGDFFGLLGNAGIKPCYHWFIMRLNDMFSPRDFDETYTTYLMPSLSDLDSAMMTWRTTQFIKT